MPIQDNTWYYNPAQRDFYAPATPHITLTYYTDNLILHTIDYTLPFNFLYSFFFLKDPPPPEFSPLPHHAPLPTPPPASRYSSLARGTLVKPGALAFPVIAGVTGPNGLWNTRFVYDRGSRYVAADVSGIISTEPPKDRKSTRLNSSHSQISYAVFCL